MIDRLSHATAVRNPGHDAHDGTAHTFSCCELSFSFMCEISTVCLVAICQRSLSEHNRSVILLYYTRTYSRYKIEKKSVPCLFSSFYDFIRHSKLQKGGVPAAPSGTATLLRLSPNHQFHPRPPLAVADFRCPRLSWLDGRCVQGPGTYSPRHG